MNKGKENKDTQEEKENINKARNKHESTRKERNTY